jgi:hypothetical protein
MKQVVVGIWNIHVSSLCFKLYLLLVSLLSRAATSTLPPAALHPPLDHALPRSCSPSCWEAGASHLEATRSLPLLLLSTRAPPSSSFSRLMPSPPWELQLQIHPPRSIILQFTLASCSWSPCAPLDPLRTPLRCPGCPRAVFFSRADESAAVNTSPWPGHHGSSPRYLSHVFYSLDHLDAHCSFGFRREWLERVEMELCHRSSPLEPPFATPTPLRHVPVSINHYFEARVSSWVC